MAFKLRMISGPNKNVFSGISLDDVTLFRVNPAGTPPSGGSFLVEFYATLRVMMRTFSRQLTVNRRYGILRVDGECLVK